jgi:hypothetical protein
MNESTPADGIPILTNSIPLALPGTELQIAFTSRPLSERARSGALSPTELEKPVERKQPAAALDVSDRAAQRNKLIETARLLATPIDLEGLVQSGALAPAPGGWYEVLDAERVPAYAWQQAVELRHERREDGRRNFIKFSVNNAAAAELYEQLTGERLKPA